MSNPWLSRIGPPRPGRPVLLLFPHAGSGASAFQRWRSVIPEDVEVLAVQLPGRETRLEEPLVRDLPALVEVVGEGLGDVLDRPYALFGHSIGSLLAFEVTLLLRRTGRSDARCLGLSAFPAPHTLVPQKLHELPDDVILRFLRDLSYIPERLVGQKGFTEMYLPVLKADFALASDYRLPAEDPLPFPVRVFGGDNDPFATPEQLAGWSEYAGGEFSRTLFNGNHFYLYDHGPEILTAIAEPLVGTTSGGSGDE